MLPADFLAMIADGKTAASWREGQKNSKTHLTPLLAGGDLMVLSMGHSGINGLKVSCAPRSSFPLFFFVAGNCCKLQETAANDVCH